MTIPLVFRPVFAAWGGCFFFPFVAIYSRVVAVLVGGTGRALREGDQEPGFACHRAVKVSQGLKSPWGQEMRDFSPLWHVLVPGIFQLLVLKVRAILNDFRADSVTRRVWRHHSPGSVLLVCLFLGSAWVFYWLPAAGGPSACSWHR